MLKKLGRLKEAVAVYRQAAKLEPYFRRDLADLLVEIGDGDGAVAVWQEVIRRSPEDFWAYDRLGVVLEKLGRLKKAEAAYRRAVELQPSSPGFRSALANVLLAQGKGDGALALWQEVLHEMPGDAQAHNATGYVLEQLGRPKEAEAAYRRAIERLPKWLEARKLEPDPGKMSPWWAEFRRDLANLLVAQGDGDGAVALWQAAIEQQPTFAEAHDDLGDVLKALGRLTEAEAEDRQAIALHSMLAVAHFHLGRILEQQDRREEAIEAYQRAAALDDEEARAALKRLGVE